LGGMADDFVLQLPDFGRKSFGFLLIGHHSTFIAAYLGCLRSRKHVPLLLQPDLHPALLLQLIEHYQPDWIVAPAGITLPADYETGRADDVSRILVRRRNADAPALHEDLGLLLSTSGSTGTRKLVRLSYCAIASNADAIAQYLKLNADDRAITTLPLGYSFGMSILNSHLAAGASLVLTNESLMSRDFWNIASETGVTSLSGVPSSFEMMRRAGLEKRGLNHLRSLTQAGGRLRKELIAFFDELARAQGWEFFVMYGQTEASPRISYVPPKRLAEKIGSIGVAIPGGNLHIDPASSELVFEGPNVMMGYAETRTDLARGDDLNGVLRTGDLGRQDDEGYVYLEGRLSRFVKLSGVRINLDAVEETLAGKFGNQFAATGSDDALVIWNPEPSQHADSSITAVLRELFNIFPSMVSVRSVDELPLLPNGKLDYRSLNEIAR